MRRDEALGAISAREIEIRRFGVSALAIFGSVARDEARPDSDVDILVEFNEPIGLFGFVRLKHYLERLLGHSVDLVTLDALRPEMRDRVCQEAVTIYAG